MKLFQKLLLAPAAIGLFAPMAANASEANLMDVSSYSQVDVEVTQDTFKPLSTKNPLLAGGEGLGQDFSNDFDTDTFSATTSASFSSNWVIGSVDGVANEEKIGATYDWGVDLTTSFDGNDSLDVSLEAGEGGATLTEMDLTETGDAVEVGEISYTRAVGDYLTLYVSPAGGGSGSALFSKACVYEGQTNTLDDCATLATGMDLGYGTAFSASIDVGNGIGIAFGYEGEATPDGSEGLMTDEGIDAYAVNLSYIRDNYGFSYTFMVDENSQTTGSGTDDDPFVSNVLGTGETEYQSINAFFTPSIERFPSLSVGFEWENDNAIDNDDRDETTHYFIGAQFDEIGNGTLGAAVGSKEPTREDLDAQIMWEAYYSYNYADGITITPVVYVKENSADGVDDETGLILKTSFEF